MNTTPLTTTRFNEMTTDTKTCACGQPATHVLLGLAPRDVCSECYARAVDTPTRQEPQYYLGGCSTNDPLTQVSYRQWRAANNG